MDSSQFAYGDVMDPLAANLLAKTLNQKEGDIKKAEKKLDKILGSSTQEEQIQKSQEEEGDGVLYRFAEEVGTGGIIDKDSKEYESYYETPFKDEKSDKCTGIEEYTLNKANLQKGEILLSSLNCGMILSPKETRVEDNFIIIVLGNGNKHCDVSSNGSS